jgi:riboflavin synthase
MFTGLIGAVGALTGIGRRGDHLVFRVRPKPALDAVAIGESISLDGYCQTVVAVTGDEFSVEVSPETVARTTAGERRVGDRLNVERSLRLGDRLGGHLVAGHVDGVGQVRRVEERGEFVRIAIDAPPDVLRYCVPKGSIAVDGVSLTINSVDDSGFEVGIIPHTWSATVLHERRPGARVNLEADLIGKYVERFLTARFAAPSQGVTETLLAEAGFLETKQR